MRLLPYFAIFSLLVAALTACQSAQENSAQSNVTKATPATSGYPDGARRITPTELRDLLAKNQAVVVDVRNEGSYYAGHIPGAKLIPNTAILSHLQELPRNKLIVTYCS
ncbi:MAG TPA: rhodanese-like domain-containing protein [Pyrinomonadaceae bacterium]|nr:rhodanese-like domain-containing protein [Pyrinomonadaceae bacterium]